MNGQDGDQRGVRGLSCHALTALDGYVMGDVEKEHHLGLIKKLSFLYFGRFWPSQLRDTFFM